MSENKNYFDLASPASRHQMVVDLKQMAAVECGIRLDDEEAESVARELLRGQHDSEALYGATTRQLCALVSRAAPRRRR